MELTVALALSILGSVIAVSTFVLNRRDKAVKDKGEQDSEKTEQVLLNYRLDQVEKKLDQILDKLDTYDKEMDSRIEKALDNHVQMYHKGDQNE